MIYPSAMRAMRVSDLIWPPLGIDSASAAAEEDAMTDPNSPDRIDPTDTIDDTTRDPDRHSTWNTIDGTVDVDEVLSEDDLENFLVEPMPDPLNPDPVPDTVE
jgi:hypothetical protein